MKILVPYYSQYLDVSDELWQPRACGVACLKMLLESRGGQTPSLDEMIVQGCAIGAHGEWGWKHDGLVALAKQYGVKLSRNEWRKSETMSPDELNEEGIEFLISQIRAGNAVIVSAIKKFQEADKFHMMVLTGFEEKNGSVAGFYYHDSDTTRRGEGENLFVPLDIFRSKWRKMAIF
ncbi:MAG: C39 family peptidase [Candidatus Yonathbacteria bacterium]|nr:C39 family peptidase [Candidatus Yonathbacteria bacterium]